MSNLEEPNGSSRVASRHGGGDKDCLVVTSREALGSREEATSGGRRGPIITVDGEDKGISGNDSMRSNLMKVDDPRGVAHRHKRSRNEIPPSSVEDEFEMTNDESVEHLLVWLNVNNWFYGIDEVITAAMERAVQRANQQATTTRGSGSDAAIARVIQFDDLFQREISQQTSTLIQRALQVTLRPNTTQHFQLTLNDRVRHEIERRIEEAIEQEIKQEEMEIVREEQTKADRDTSLQVQKAEMEELCHVHETHISLVRHEETTRRLRREEKEGFTECRREETCAICQTEFDFAKEEKQGILWCFSLHYYCAECAAVFCKSITGDLHSNYPPNCAICRVSMPKLQFEALLTDKQLAALKCHGTKKTMSRRNVLVQCTMCSHFESFLKPGPAAWRCKACHHGTCFVCNKDLPGLFSNGEGESKTDHRLCKALRGVKEKIEKAIEDGFQVECPSCGLSGRKDDACLHMKCPRPECGVEYCYLCGLSVYDCDKAPPDEEDGEENDIYLHNRDWGINPKRCPMYLTQILEVDLSWLGVDWENNASDGDFEDDNICLDHFHRFRTIQQLQEVMDEVGEHDFTAVFEHFPSIKASGYNVDVVKNTKTDKLIDREHYIRHRVESDDAEADHGEENNRDDDGDSEGEEDDEIFEEVPEEMTRAVLVEEEQVRQAMAASLEAAQNARGDEGPTANLEGVPIMRFG
ncbi:expressed unknown protein [Seminavis robusta]|uniref:RING-type domain-containing protein n=1 Tax=Seminavis robusta TaxID=568900 RepID=A0A9N8EEM6_9STRA|nr:expressed unknown protein [Seminavis robusta]|eukprot:Sro826_g207730.1 n/a (695) ;mRNA; f:26346-28601